MKVTGHLYDATTVSTQASTVRELLDALRDVEQFAAKLTGRRPAVFLDYDGC